MGKKGHFWSVVLSCLCRCICMFSGFHELGWDGSVGCQEVIVFFGLLLGVKLYKSPGADLTGLWDFCSWNRTHFHSYLDRFVAASLRKLQFTLQLSRKSILKYRFPKYKHTRQGGYTSPGARKQAPLNLCHSLFPLLIISSRSGEDRETVLMDLGRVNEIPTNPHLHRKLKISQDFL